VCLVILVNYAEELLEMESTEILSFLQHLPVMDMEIVVAQAHNLYDEIRANNELWEKHMLFLYFFFSFPARPRFLPRHTTRAMQQAQQRCEHSTVGVEAQRTHRKAHKSNKRDKRSAVDASACGSSSQRVFIDYNKLYYIVAWSFYFTLFFYLDLSLPKISYPGSFLLRLGLIDTK
jgi:hypothetical protein